MAIPMQYKDLMENGIVVVHHNLQAGAVSNGAKSFRFVAPWACRVKSVRTVLGTAGTVQTTIVDVNKNGTTIFTTQGNRPTIAISGTVSPAATPNPGAVSTLNAGDVLSFDVDQFGTSAADLSVSVEIVPIVPV